MADQSDYNAKEGLEVQGGTLWKKEGGQLRRAKLVPARSDSMELG